MNISLSENTTPMVLKYYTNQLFQNFPQRIGNNTVINYDGDS